MEIKWNDFKPEDFEKLCYHILEANGFSNLKWHGKFGNDKGRDIFATKIENPLPNANKQTSWIIQCKRYLSKPPNKDEISSFLNSAREFKPNNVLIMISNTLTSNTKDWLDSVKDEYKFDIYLWEEQDLKTQIIRHKDKLFEFFPRNKNLAKLISYYQIPNNEIKFGCNEIEDVEILCINCSNYDDAKKSALKFIKFIKENDIDVQ